MPSRSQRKSKAKKYPVRFVNNQKLLITKPKFLELRNNPDFHALIAIGRILNALTFAVQVMAEINSETKTAVGRRARAKNFQLAASYVHESLQVFSSLRSLYGAEPFFSDALKLAYPDGTDRNAAILKFIRDSSGFHLDQERKATAATLTNLDLKEYVLMSGDGDRIGDLYVDLSDTIDLNFWIDRFKDGRTEKETFQEIAQAVAISVTKTVSASDKILSALLLKLNLTPE